MDYVAMPSERNVVIKLSGQFVFSDTPKFKNVLDMVTTENDKAKQLVLDFSDISFIDSSGLGMLLLLRDECQKNKVGLSIKSIHGQVEKIFTLSKFEQLFTIE